MKILRFALSALISFSWIYSSKAFSADDLNRPGRASELILEKHRIRFYVDPSFSPFVKEKIRYAADIAVNILSLENLDRHPIYNCVTRYANKPGYEPLEILHYLGLWSDVLLNRRSTIYQGREVGLPIRAEIRGRRNGYFIVRIVKLTNEDNVLGKAYVGHFYNGPSVIALNAQWINGELTFDYPHDASVASTIVHEMLHTFGQEHPEDDDGTFVEETGNCIERELRVFDPSTTRLFSR